MFLKRRSSEDKHKKTKTYEVQNRCSTMSQNITPVEEKLRGLPSPHPSDAVYWSRCKICYLETRVGMAALSCHHKGRSSKIGVTPCALNTCKPIHFTHPTQTTTRPTTVWCYYHEARCCNSGYSSTAHQHPQSAFQRHQTQTTLQ